MRTRYLALGLIMFSAVWQGCEVDKTSSGSGGAACNLFPPAVLTSLSNSDENINLGDSNLHGKLDQTFSPASDMQIAQVVFYAIRAATITAELMTLEIHPDSLSSPGFPDASVISGGISDSVSASQLSTLETAFIFSFFNPPSLDSGEVYHFVITSDIDQLDSTTFVTFRGYTASAIAGELLVCDDALSCTSGTAEAMPIADLRFTLFRCS